MFGYLSPSVASLSPSALALYRACYCGLCRATECETAKLTLSYDSVVLALFRAELSGEAPATAKGKCLRHPLKPREYLKKSPSLCYAAAAGMLLGAEKMRDDRADSRGMRRLLFSLLSVPCNSRKRRAGLPELEKAVSAHLRSLSEAEKRQEARPDVPAECFGKLLGEIFAFGLCGEGHFSAYLFGFHLGKWIYLIDAADDIENDRKSGNYNPFRFAGTNPESLRVSLLWESQKANEILSSLPVRNADARELLTNILTLGMPTRAEGILQSLFITKESL